MAYGNMMECFILGKLIYFVIKALYLIIVRSKCSTVPTSTRFTIPITALVLNKIKHLKYSHVYLFLYLGQYWTYFYNNVIYNVLFYGDID